MSTFPPDYVHLREFFHPNLIKQLYGMYFQKQFPGINPDSLTIEQWHTDAPNMGEWFKAVKRELKIIEHRSGQDTSTDWGTCDWGWHYGPLWLRDGQDLCIDCREEYDRGKRVVLDDVTKAVKKWATYLNANYTETIRSKVDLT